MMTAPEAISYDRDRDVLLVWFSERSLGWSELLDPDRVVHYAEDGTPLGVELRRVSVGVDLEGLPRAAFVADAVDRVRFDAGPAALLRRPEVPRAPLRWRDEAHARRLASRAARTIRDAGIRSVEELYAQHRYDLLKVPGLGPRAFDYINDALNRGDAERLNRLFLDDGYDG